MGSCLTDKKSLLGALQLVQGIVEKKAINPVLTSVVFEAEGETLLVKATNLEESAIIQTWAEVEEPFKVAVSAKKLVEFVRELPEMPVSLRTTDAGTLELSVEKIKANLPLTDLEDFPELPSPPEETILLNKDEFLDALDKVYFSIAADSVSIALMGMLFKKEGEVVSFVSTDGHRMSLVEKVMEGLSGEDFEVIIPRKGVQEIKRILEKRPEIDTVEVGFSENHFYMKVGGVQLFSRVLDGRFPNYKRIVPDEFEKEFVVPLQEFMRAAKRVSLFSEDRVKGVRIEFNPDESRIVVSSMASADSGFVGAAVQEIEVGECRGTPFVFGLNARYLMEVLGAFGTESVRVCAGENMWPVKLTSDEAPDYIHIIMPLKLEG